MCEPLSVGVHACRRANVGPETNVLVMGAGPIGLVALLAARAFGSPRIVIVDVDDHRLSVAKELGADETVYVSTNINVSVSCCFANEFRLSRNKKFMVSLYLKNVSCIIFSGNYLFQLVLLMCDND